MKKNRAYWLFFSYQLHIVKRIEYLWIVTHTCISNLQVRGDKIVDFIIIDEKKEYDTASRSHLLDW